MCGFDNLQIIKTRWKRPYNSNILKGVSFKDANKMLSRPFNFNFIIAFTYYTLKSEVEHYFGISKLQLCLYLSLHECECRYPSFFLFLYAEFLKYVNTYNSELIMYNKLKFPSFVCQKHQFFL